MGNLMLYLNIPGAVQVKIREHSTDEEQQRKEWVHYWRNVSPYSMIGWGYLGGKLQYYGQEAALRAANKYIQRAPGICGCGLYTYMYWKCRPFVPNSCL
jgi:hypothetical protein